MEKKLEYRVTGQDVPCKVEDLLKKRLGLSRHQISSAKYRRDGICLDGKQVRVSQAVRPGERLQVLLEEESTGSPGVTPSFGPVEILYEDEDLAAVNKPPGLVVHPAHGHYRDTLANYMQYYYESKKQQVKIRPVGRLDGDTSGIVLFAKNQVAAARLWGGQKESLDGRKYPASLERGDGRNRVSIQSPVEKEYWALVEGCFSRPWGRVELPLGKKPGTLNQMEVREGGLWAATNYRVLREYGNVSLLSLTLETGRTHQIRVHMAASGHPLLGDRLYGGEEKEIGRAALHCRRARVVLPFTGELREIEAPLPEDMRELLERLEKKQKAQGDARRTGGSR